MRVILPLALGVMLVSVPARAADNWNQWDEPAVSGVGRGATKLALGIDWAHVPGGHSVRLGGDFEHLLADHWSLQGRVGIPLEGEWVAPAMLGIRFHVLPLHPFDPFLGAAGGVAWLRPTGRDARLDPVTSGAVGFTFHYFGLFFVEAEGRFDLVRYAASEGARDLSGVVIDGRTGVYF